MGRTNIDAPFVQPQAHKGLLTTTAFTLGNLTFVMREDVVFAARVNVDLRSEELGTHGTALNVPTRESIAPGRKPAQYMMRIFADAFLPKGKVRRMAFVFVHSDARAFAKVVEGG